MAHVELAEFDLTRITRKSVVALVGKRNVGKSTMVRHIMYEISKTNPPVVAVFSGTDVYTRFYRGFIPSRFIHSSFSPKLLENIMDRQELVARTNQERQRLDKPLYDPHAIIIFDDILDDSKRIFGDKNVKRVFFQGRHMNLMCLVCSQYAMSIDRQLRSNVDFTFIHRENNVGNRKRLYDNFAGMFPSLEVFNATLDRYTAEYGTIVIDNTVSATTIEECVFHFTASIDLPPFQLTTV